MQRDKIKPILFSVIKHSSKEELRRQIPKDIVSGIVVAVVALPLSIALAIASGVSPERGIYTAIVAGFLIAMLGGSRVQISGPTAAFATIVAGIVATDGLEGLVAATLIAGVILILMGLLKLGTLIRFVPYTITTGFTAGIAVTIVIGQIKDFLGLTYPAGTVTIDAADKLAAVVDNASATLYAVACCGYAYATVGGLDVDANMNVLREDGTAIENLYAVGQDSEGVCNADGKPYTPWGGQAQSWTFVSGQIAGTHAAGRQL